MISRLEERQVCGEAKKILADSGILLSESELDSMTSADFGLSRLRTEGLQVVTLLETDMIGMKILVLLPGQTMVEHWHPKRGDDPGKEETLRCLGGLCMVYTPGEDTLDVGFIPDGQDKHYTCRHETVLEPADQYTFRPGVPHWFQTGPDGCVVMSISTRVTDLDDKFSNPDVIRQTTYSDD